MNHCRGPNRVIGYAWSKKSQKKPWSRFIIRECPDCEVQTVQPVVLVREDYAMCLHCLSQDLAVVTAIGERTVWKCNECGRRTEVLPEPV
jgi:ribosomal protein S27E